MEGWNTGKLVFKRILCIFNFILNTNSNINPTFHYPGTPGPDRDNVSERIKLLCLKALQSQVPRGDMSHQGGPLFQHSIIPIVSEAN